MNDVIVYVLIGVDRDFASHEQTVINVFTKREYAYAAGLRLVSDDAYPIYDDFTIEEFRLDAGVGER